MEENLNIIDLSSSSENYTCSICLEENIEEQLSTTNCSHTFCNKCLEDWLNKGKYSCPLCRSDIKTFTTNDKETRIFPVLVGSNMPMINNIPVSTIMTNLAYYNVRLKCGLYLSFGAFVILCNYYARNKYDYSDLLDTYKQCVTNLTTYQDTYRGFIQTGVYDTTYHSLQICTIPLYFYNKCFY